MDLKREIVEIAQKSGIDIIGFTKAEKFYNLREFLLKRREMNYESEFEEKDLELRLSPKKLLPEVNTIIVLGISYNVDYKAINKIIYKGRLSKSSWGIDYHKVLKEKMDTLIKKIKKIIDFKYKTYVDTGPLIDREVAKRAGIGWYGKNCSIINDRYGSFIFIGYILTDLKIEEDTKVVEKCGECNLCIKACPTSAIEDKYIINTKKCISYLTQTKEKISYELREKMGIKIYGCDTCQLVCPINKEAHKSQHSDFIPNVTKGYMDLEEVLNISNKKFKERYIHIAGSWRGKNILRRNSIVALGNIGDKKSLELLKKLIKDPSPMIREYSAWAILIIDKIIGQDIVKEAMKIEKDRHVKEEMGKLLIYFR